MLFNTLDYWLFLPVAVAAYYIVPHKLRNAVLLAASYWFYYQSLVLSELPVSLIFALPLATLIAYGAGLLAPRLSGRAKGAVKILALLAVLGILLYFKYTNFFIEALNGLLAAVGSGRHFGALGLLAPIGVSVFTFQAIGYILDVNNGKRDPERNIVIFALFLAFFPQILSGPIGRANQLLPQFRQRHALRYQNLLFGGQRFLWGLFKKAVAADWLYLVVEAVYAKVSANTGAPLLMAALLYGLFLYLDFSAYSDMALGSAKMMGFDLLENFDAPYYATNFSGFWKRWHMSLTSWLTDYIFTPLVWSRWVNKLVFGKKWNDHAPHFAANLIIVFLISGFWHGATVNFLIWGLLQGLFRCFEELLHKLFGKPRKLKSPLVSGLRNTGKRLMVYLAFTLSLAFFRLPTPSDVAFLFRNLFVNFRFSDMIQSVQATVLGNVSNSQLHADIVFAVVGASLLLVALLDWFIIYKAPKDRDCPGNVLQHLRAVPRWLCYLFMIAAILVVGVFGKSGFIYAGVMG